MKTFARAVSFSPFLALLLVVSSCPGGQVNEREEVEQARGVLEMLKGKVRAVMGKKDSHLTGQLDTLAENEILFDKLRCEVATRIKRSGLNKALKDIFDDNSVDSIRKTEELLGSFVEVQTEDRRNGYVNAAMMQQVDSRESVKWGKEHKWLIENSGREGERLFKTSMGAPFFKTKPTPGGPQAATVRLEAQTPIVLTPASLRTINEWHLPFPFCLFLQRCD